MNNLTNKQQKIAKRQDLLSQMIPNAVSCDYIASVDRMLPNGFEIKTVNINCKGFAYRMTAYKNGKAKEYNSYEVVLIQGVRVYYIICEPVLA
jgi:hypothetical protein